MRFLGLFAFTLLEQPRKNVCSKYTLTCTVAFLAEEGHNCFFFSLWQKSVVLKEYKFKCVSKSVHQLFGEVASVESCREFGKSRGRSVFRLWRGRGNCLLILFERTHTQSLTPSLIWALFKLNCNVMLSLSVPKDKETHAFPHFYLEKASFISSSVLIVFYKLSQNFHLQRAVVDPYGIGQMFCPSLRKFFVPALCVLGVCSPIITSSQGLIIQPSCDQVLVHSNKINNLYLS